MKETVAILTNHMEFNPGYSLTGIILDQVHMLCRHGHRVRLLVNEQFDPRRAGDLPDGCDLVPAVPFAHLTDYATVRDLSEDHARLILHTTDVLYRELAECQAAFSHDWAFTGWFLPYGLACYEAGRRLSDVRWMHWVHSIPSGMRDWWRADMDHFSGHKIVFPNETDRLLVAEQYRGAIDDVRVVPHIRDIRRWLGFCPASWSLVDLLPALLSADVVQVLPAGADRLAAKRVDRVIEIFGHIKRLGRSVCLLIANQWATTTRHAEDAGQYKELATRCGLRVGEEIAFISDLGYTEGLPQRMMRELGALGNLFVFPTREESFGLVLPEAVLSGGALPVLNASLDMQREVSGGHALFFDFGSNRRAFEPSDWTGYLRDVARIILGRMDQSEALRARTLVRQRYNMDRLYLEAYSPLLAEARTWKEERCASAA